MIRKNIAYLKNWARRQRNLFWPAKATREYRTWIAQRIRDRSQLYQASAQPGLLTVITAVWDGSPLPYLRELAISIADQAATVGAEWLILDNGCSHPGLRDFFEEQRQHQLVSIVRSEKNLGIVQGMRVCLEQAGGRYVLPVDADDTLYPDALRIVASFLEHHHYPPLLYSDEDKVSGNKVEQPYFKPGWDPVLLANSAYVAHLGVVDRETAMQLGCYDDERTEGSPDWDLFLRFASAGYQAIRIPEILYSWRIHPQSTADDAATKPYILASQTAALDRHLQCLSPAKNFSVEPSPLFEKGSAHFKFVRTQNASPPALTFRHDNLEQLRAVAEEMSLVDGYVCLVSVEIEVQSADWREQAFGLSDLFPDTVMVGGRISDRLGLIRHAAEQFGFAGICGSPDQGRQISDPGYFGQMWKQRSTGAVDTRLALVNGRYLKRVLEQLPFSATFAYLGWWIGAAAAKDRRRIIYCPFVHGTLRQGDRPAMTQDEEESFRERYGDLLPDRRFYPEPFSLIEGYRIAK